MILDSTITCQVCGTTKTERMPTDACQFFYQCTGCGTPCGLPFSFAYAPHVIQKQLASSGFFHTPGWFRALQNDYRIEGETRQRAITLLSQGYRLPRDEAEGLLSGQIAIEVNKAAGTITYTIAL